MRVYYLTTAQFGLSNIALRRIKVARFSELNDPFELLAVDVANFDLRVGVLAKKAQVDQSTGVICFSRAWRQPLLWSHYGEKHHGMCLGFDIPDDQLVSVRYVKGLHKINVVSPSTKQSTIDNLLDRLKFTKFEGWKYENEVRYLVSLNSIERQSGLYFVPFSESLLLREVVLGPRCDIPIKAVRTLVQSYDPAIRVMQSRIAFSKFAVVKR